jgi:hypothetical protein
MKRLLLAVPIMLALAACNNDADVASANLSQAADNFQINRRIVFYNTMTGENFLEIDGLCSKDNSSTDTKLAVVCKTGPTEYKKHFLGLSGAVTYFIEQIDAAPANVYHYKVTFKPASILPDIDYKREAETPQ